MHDLNTGGGGGGVLEVMVYSVSNHVLGSVSQAAEVIINYIGVPINDDRG